MTPRPLESGATTGEARTDALARLVAIVDRLRAPDGCPWDLKQTLVSVAPHLVEESHEVLEAVEEAPAAGDEHVVEEAGDLLMGVVLLARIAEDERRFDLARVANAVSEKLVRRHPHVFGEARAADAEQALANWEAIKRAERADSAARAAGAASGAAAGDSAGAANGAANGAADASALAGSPKALPALQRAKRLGEKAMAAGFRWENARGALAKLREELAELEQAFEHAENRKDDGAARAALEHELGDVILAAAFLGNYVSLDPERATRLALRRFEERFRSMEQDLAKPLSDCTLTEMMAAWGRAKSRVG